MRYVLSPLFREDLMQIGDWIAADHPHRALTFVQELRSEAARIARLPQQFRLRPEIGADARLAVFGSYVPLYRIQSGPDGDFVRFERVVHGSRDLPSLAT